MQTDITKGTPPSSTSYAGVRFGGIDGADVDANQMCALLHSYYPNGVNVFRMQVTNPQKGSTEKAELAVAFAPDGTFYASAPTPSDENDNSTKIATTEWVTVKVKNYLNSIEGEIKFSGNTMQSIQVADDGDLLIGSSSDSALLRLRGGTSATNPGGFQIRAKNNDKTAYLIGSPDGTLTWQNRKVIDSGAGTVILKAGAIPAGYLACDGSAKSRTEYADLFAAIGTTYGTGDGSTTFNLPDMDAPHASMKYLIKI